MTYRGYDFEYSGIRYNIISGHDHTCATAYEYNLKPGNTAYGNLVIPEVAYDGSKPYTVVGIGNGSLKDSRDLTERGLPNSLEYIDFDAFNGCSNLTQVTNLRD